MEALISAIAPLLDVLRPYLLPILTSLPAPLIDGLTTLLGASCATKLLALQPDAPCASLLLSKLLGLAIVAASAVVKLPQLRALYQSGSARGLSFPAYVLETAAFAITCAYGARSGFPFSTYGESVLVAAQNVAIGALILHLQGQSQGAAAWVAGVASGGFALSSARVVGPVALQRLMAAAGVLSSAAKVPQIYTVWKEGGTGQLSAFAVFNYLLGSLARIFTTLQEVPDTIVLAGYVAGFALNLVLALQMVYYWKTPVAEPKRRPGRPKKVAAANDSNAAAGTATGAKPSVKSPTTRRRG